MSPSNSLPTTPTHVRTSGICWNCVAPCTRRCSCSLIKMGRSHRFLSCSRRRASTESQRRPTQRQRPSVTTREVRSPHRSDRTSTELRVTDSDSLLHDSLSSNGDRGQGSVSSKQRVRIKLDSNLDLKIEKMELDREFILVTYDTPSSSASM